MYAIRKFLIFLMFVFSVFFTSSYQACYAIEITCIPPDPGMRSTGLPNLNIITDRDDGDAEEYRKAFTQAVSVNAHEFNEILVDGISLGDILSASYQTRNIQMICAVLKEHGVSFFYDGKKQILGKFFSADARVGMFTPTDDESFSTYMRKFASAIGSYKFKKE